MRISVRDKVANKAVLSRIIKDALHGTEESTTPTWDDYWCKYILRVSVKNHLYHFNIWLNDIDGLIETLVCVDSSVAPLLAEELGGDYIEGSSAWKWNSEIELADPDLSERLRNRISDFKRVVSDAI